MDTQDISPRGSSDTFEQNDSPLQKIARRVLLAICLINGIAAPLCGILMIASPDGQIMHMQEVLIEMQTWPFAEVFFRDLTWSGIALLCVNGIPNLICLALRWAKRPSYTIMGVICGILLILWCTFEMFFIPNGVTVFYLIIGIIQTTVALFCAKRKK